MNLEMRRGAGQGVGLWSSVAVSQRTCVSLAAGGRPLDVKKKSL